MSKLGKWCLGILLCGVILVGASWALGLRDFNIGNSAFRGEKKTRRLETVTDVTVKLTLQNFEIRQGGTYAAIEYPAYKDPSMRLDIQQENGKLIIHAPKGKGGVQLNLSNILDNEWKNQKIILFLPKDAKLKHIVVQQEIGNTQLNKVQAEQVKFTSSVGELEADGCTIGNLNAESQTGGLRVSESNLSSSYLQSNVGAIQLHIKPSGTIEAHTNTAPIGVTTFGVKRVQAILKSDTGEVSWQGKKMKNSYYRECEKPEAIFSLESDTGTVWMMDQDLETEEYNASMHDPMSIGISSEVKSQE